MVDCLSPEGVPSRFVAGEPHVGAPEVVASLLVVYQNPVNQESLFLSCEGIAISSSSVGVSNSTFPSSDSFNSSVSYCNMFLDHGEKISSLCTPPCSAKAQSWSRVPKCNGLKKGGKAAEITPGYSLIVYSITEAPPLLHDHKAYEGIVPQRAHLGHEIDIHIIYSLYSLTCTNSHLLGRKPLSRSIKVLVINHTVSCPLGWHHIIYSQVLSSITYI